MKNLARHIELLLRNNDCVILPGFGGFIAHDVPAYYVSEEGLYYPPSRSISFNAAITMNDGLLVQSYMKSYQVDYARATYMVDVAVEQLTDMLDEEGCATLPHIGTLTQDIHLSLQFTPDAAGIASPGHFGLSSFVIKELSQMRQPAELIQKAESTTRKAKTIDIHINREMLHRVMSTAAVFLLLLMVALPTGNHRPTDVASLRLTELVMNPRTQPAEPTPESVPTATEAHIASCDTVQAVATSSLIMEEAAPMVESTIMEATPTKEEEVTPTEEVTNTEISQPSAITSHTEKTYHIIVASLPSHRGADEALKQYVGMGYPEASLVDRDNRVRISLVQFADKNEANAYLNTLRQQEKFQNAWLLAVRN